jgi:hypothetical protein
MSTRYLPAPKAGEPELKVDMHVFSTPTLTAIERELSAAARNALRRRDFRFAGPLNAACASMLRVILERSRE